MSYSILFEQGPPLSSGLRIKRRLLVLSPYFTTTCSLLHSFESVMNIFTTCELLWFLWDIPAKNCCTVFMPQSIFCYSHLHCKHLAGTIFHVFVKIWKIFQVMSDLANYLGVCVSLTSACLSMVVSSSLTDFLWFQFWEKKVCGRLFSYYNALLETKRTLLNHLDCLLVLTMTLHTIQMVF